MVKVHGSLEGVDQELFLAALRFNAKMFGLVFGIFGAIVLIVMTQVSLAMWGDNAGGYLGLLGVFLPGYSVSPSGTLIGAIWAFLFAGLAGYLIYWSYGRVVGRNLAAYISEQEATTDPMLKPATMRLYGVALGTALGAAIGLALFASTVWLVLRGTADSSVHAALLGNYLPGYTVSVVGGLIGALELFVLVFVSSVMLAAIYNKVVDLREGKG